MAAHPHDIDRSADRHRSACLRPVRRVLPRPHRPARIPGARERASWSAVSRWRRRCSRAMWKRKPCRSRTRASRPSTSSTHRPAATPARCAATSCSRRGDGPFPSVLVIHENRGLESVRRGRRAARGRGRVPRAGARRAGARRRLSRQRRRRPHAAGGSRPGQAAPGHGQQRAVLEGTARVERASSAPRASVGAAAW